MRSFNGADKKAPSLGQAMSKTIALFNHKGGVSKTTTTFNLGWMLAEMGKRVVLVDTDPQCNLTGLILGEELDSFYTEHPEDNIHAALAPAFLSQPRELTAPPCREIGGRAGLFLLPGHVNLSEYEVTLGIAQELSGTIQALKNLPGAFSYLIAKITERYSADYILVDMSPSLGSLNQNILMSSDGFLVPTSPDYFSLMAIDSLCSILPRWSEWAKRAYLSDPLRTAAYPFRSPNLKFYGTIVQKYRPRLGAATTGFQSWIDKINDAVKDKLFQRLSLHQLTLSAEAYQAAGNSPVDSYCLCQIPDFNTLAATSQLHRTPVFALTDAMFGHTGAVLASDHEKRSQFHALFHGLAERVISLSAHA
jgi:cellulose biosynthesis protein BcsQ